MKSPRVRKWYEKAQSTPLGGFEPSKTVQCDTTDVNTIVERFKRTGVMPNREGTPQYGDVSALQGKDLTELINMKSDIESRIREAQSQETADENASTETAGTKTQDVEDKTGTEVPSGSPPESGGV